jgi:hypothetical protein
MKKSLVIAFVAVLIIPAVFVYASRFGQSKVVKDSVYARDVALEYLLENYPELSDLVNPSTTWFPWNVKNLTPKNWVGSNTIQFTKGDWTITVSNAVVLEPVYTVEVEYIGSNTFSWKGTIDQAGDISVIEFSQ